MARERGDQLVKVASARDEVEANVWRDTLEKEGIAVYVRNVDPLSPFGIPSSLPFSLDLFVLARDEKRARWLLGEIEATLSEEHLP